MDIREKIGAKIAELRKEKGLTQVQLAQISDVSERTIQGIEAGAFSARLDILDKLAEALECSIEITKK